MSVVGLQNLAEEVASADGCSSGFVCIKFLFRKIKTLFWNDKKNQAETHVKNGLFQFYFFNVLKPVQG